MREASAVHKPEKVDGKPCWL